MRLFLPMLVLFDLSLAQQPYIERATLDFSYTAPTSWSIYVTREVPGQEIDFEARSSFYSWRFYFSVRTSSSYVMAAVDALTDRWYHMKFHQRGYSTLDLAGMQDTVWSSGIYTTYAGYFYPASTMANAFLSYGASYRNHVFSYYTGSTSSIFVAESTEMLRVRDGLYIGPIPVAIGPALPKKSQWQDGLVSDMVDALGRRRSAPAIPNREPLIKLMKPAWGP